MGSETPGLKWRKRKGGRVAYWTASENAIQAGFGPRTVNLAHLGEDAVLLAQACQHLDTQQRAWLSGLRPGKGHFDGTFGMLLDIYQTDPQSGYRDLKHGTRRTYDVYLRKLAGHIGDYRIDEVDGRDLRRWFETWSEARAKLGAGRMALAVLKAAVTFGVMCRMKGCAEFKVVMGTLEFPTLPRRKWAPTADQITAARAAAHDHGAPRRALAYALQYETTARAWDIIGQWVPLDDPRPSAILSGRYKWIGPTWAAIDKGLVLRLTPTKTEDTTAVSVAYDLRACPMVMEELARLPDAERTGPLIVFEGTGGPYHETVWRRGWRADFTAAGMPEGVWNRDLRAGGITEGRRGGADIRDAAAAAGHSGSRTTARVYDRDTLEAHRRVMGARAKVREGE